ncbi:GNAT family N-acetyltransferase [Palleronia sp. KMU-117]|uniref:GNAT family N-acetyltransferase n=1 Tax=Palleronia sp. KMU-117 TaxID=3434108 RepID=UPI003D761D9C
MIRAGPALPGFEDWAGLHDLLAQCFGPMEGRIAPPSSFAAMTPDTLRAKAAGEVLILAHDGDRLVGCAFCAPRIDHLYLGKLAVAPLHRRQGVLRRMLAEADAVARRRGLPALVLKTRVELAETHATFAALGFQQTGTEAHPGFDRPTSLAFRRAVALP